MKFSIILPLVISIAGCGPSFNPDNSYKGKIQAIPGRVECEFFNTGGEGTAYHDIDSVNNGSGKLNPVNGNLLNEFRIKFCVVGYLDRPWRFQHGVRRCSGPVPPACGGQGSQRRRS